MQGPVHDAYVVAFFDNELVAKFDIFIKDYRRDSSRRLESEAFHHNHVEILEVEA